MTEPAPDLPPPPEDALDLLRQAEARLNDLHVDFRAIREALEGAPRPKADEVAGTIPSGFSGRGVLGVGAAIAAPATVTATGVVGTPSVSASGSASGETVWTGSATGHAPASPQLLAWLAAVAGVAVYGKQIVEFFDALVTLLDNLNN